ncbi:hypothetical protein HDU97_002382, partial [Phlyctochytrium planicorne]
MAPSTAIIASLLTFAAATFSCIGANAWCLQAPEQDRLDAWIATKKGPLFLDYLGWDSGNVYNEIVKILAEEVLSYPVAYGAIDNANVYNWTGLLAGTIHASMDVWLGDSPSAMKYVTDYALSSNRKLEIAGANGQNAQAAWFIPEWILDPYPALGTYRGLRDPNIAKVLSLNSSIIAKISKPVYAQIPTNKTEWYDSNSKALILAVMPEYGDHVEERLIKNLGMNAVVEFSGDSDTYMISIWREMTLAGLPTILSLWIPHSVFSEYIFRNDSRFKLTRFALPEYNAKLCLDGPDLNCGRNSQFPQKILSTTLQAYSDELYWLIKQVTLSNDDVNLMLGQITYRNATIEQAACAWLQDNEKAWRQWVWFRNCPGGCGVNGYCTFNKCVCNAGYEGNNCESLRIIHWVPWKSAAGIAVLFATCLVLIAITGVGVVIIINRASEVVKAQGFIFNVLILASFIPALLGPFLAIGEPNITTCNIKICYRILSIFSAQKKLQNVTDLKLLMLLLPFVVGEILLLSLLTTTGKASIQIIQDGGSGKWIKACQFDNARAIVPALIVYKVFLVVGAVILAYKTKDIPDRFGESKSIALAIYNMTVVSASFIVVLFIVKVDESIWFVIYSLTVILVCIVFVTIFFGRIMYFIVFKPNAVEGAFSQSGNRKSSMSHTSGVSSNVSGGGSR